MAQATFSVRMDNDLKRNFAIVCNSFGMNMSTAINIFANAVVDSRKIPFEIKSPKTDEELLKETIISMRKTSKTSKPNGYTLSEINNVIKSIRTKRKTK